MEMTIEDCVKELLLNKEDDTYVLTKETTDFAVDTMHKYQQIEQAYSAYLETMNPDTLADLISTII